MDFEQKYTDEQERFRRQVQDWLEKNVPEEMKEPIDRRADFSEDMARFWRTAHKELAAKGWLFPTYRKQYGGGGLTPEHDTIIQEEFDRFRIPRFGSELIIAMLFVWGTEEQKQKFLVPLLKAEKTSWQKFTEPHSGSDLASYESKAVRDGDDWVLNGSNVFISGRGTPDYLWGPMLTDPNAPRHRNLGFFMIPNPSAGLSMRTMALVNGNEQHFVFLDNVRVPGDHLIGGDHEGWQVTNTGLEFEHGGRGQAFPSDSVVENLLDYVRQERRAGRSPGGDPVLQQETVDAYLEAHLHGLFQKRTYDMYQKRMVVGWEGASSALYGRHYGLRNAGRVRNIMGMSALLGIKEPLAPQRGIQEVEQRNSLQHMHGAGSLNIAKVTVARRIGISRTKERPAPTPMTATSQPA
ncbi:MAG: acyl-CoA dehydrogenase family protein [Dehalococcoidia bacterium]|nr:acyl-CoA dehydrogenase family protein [Dehalococcoidia bacterium]